MRTPSDGQREAVIPVGFAHARVTRRVESTVGSRNRVPILRVLPTYHRVHYAPASARMVPTDWQFSGCRFRVMQSIDRPRAGSMGREMEEFWFSVHESRDGAGERCIDEVFDEAESEMKTKRTVHG